MHRQGTHLLALTKKLLCGVDHDERAMTRRAHAGDAVEAIEAKEAI